MARITRAGSTPRPMSGGWELAVWYLMRLTALGLFVLVLAHFTIVHFIYDPAVQNANWIAARWSGAAWRTVDWLMLAAVTFHAFMGMRTVTQDYTKGALRTALTLLLYLVAILIFAMGTMALVTFPDAVQVAS
jgi:succinate dehydrogenase hydrophobic anchor subunit